MKTFIIAEAGVNHNGNFETALRLIDAATEAGANAVKFQTFCAAKTVVASAAKIKYQRNRMDRGFQLEMLKKLELSPQDHSRIFLYARRKGILPLSSPFDEESADVLDRLGVNLFKVSSGEITNKFLVQHIASKKKPIILSTGMSDLVEVGKCVNWILDVWGNIPNRPSLTLLHCVSNYPARVEDCNLRAIKTMERAFGLPVGYSDHTLGIEIPIAAVALGAAIIEKHITLDRNLSGPDHKASIEPEEFKQMVRGIRNIEKAVGDGLKKPVIREKEMRMLVRRSLVAARDLPEGWRISVRDVRIKRPGTGIPPEFRDTIVGMRIRRKVLSDNVLSWEDFTSA